jgi:hypothetical protein
MKRNVSLIVLTFEIAAIIILHAVKMNQSQPQGASITIAKVKISTPVVKHYQLLSIK